MVYHKPESKKAVTFWLETLPKKQVEQAVEIHVTVSRKYFRPTAKTRRQSDVTRKSAQNQFIASGTGSRGNARCKIRGRLKLTN